MPHLNRCFTDFSGFPVATRNFAIATTRRRSFATNCGSTLYTLLSWGDAMQTALFWSQVDAFIVSEPTKFERIHQLPRYASSSSSVAKWVWSSFANLSISRITSSERPNSIIVFLNHKSRINLSWMFLYCFFRLLLKLICRVVFFATFFRTCDRVARLSWFLKCGIEKRSNTDLMYFLFSFVSSFKKCPHVQ